MEDSLRYMMYAVLGLAVAGLLLVYFNGGVNLITSLFLGENIEKIISDCELACLSGESYEFCTRPRTIISEKGSRESGTCKDFSSTYPDFFDKCLEIKCLESSFKVREVSEVKNALEYAKVNLVSGTKCSCGDFCNEYASWIVEAAASRNPSANKNPSTDPLDPLLLVSVFMRESNCDVNAGKSITLPGSVGLAQIETGVWCGTPDAKRAGINFLSTNSETCRAQLIGNNARNSIIAAAEILKYKYSSSSQTYSVNGKIYSGWDAALRGYNGWGSGGNNDYVEEVNAIYNKLKAHTS